MRQSNYLRLVLLTLMAFVIVIPCHGHSESSEASAENIQESQTYLQAKSLMDSGDYKKAIDVLLVAQKNGEDRFEISQLLVESYQGRIDQVGILKKRGLAIKMRKSMEHSLSLRPDDIQVRKDLIRFHLNAPGAVGGSKDEARELIQGIPDITESNILIYEAQISQAENDNAGAMVHLKQALTLEPQNAGALTLKGNIQIESENYADALLTFETCTDFHPNNMGCRYLIGKVAHVGNIDVLKGIQALESFISSDYDGEALRAHAHYRLGDLYAESDQAEKAKTEYEKAISINGLEKAKAALSQLD